jgi:hypothetical protein
MGGLYSENQFIAKMGGNSEKTDLLWENLRGEFKNSADI